MIRLEHVEKYFGDLHVLKEMIDEGIIEDTGFDAETFNADTWKDGVSFRQYDDYPAISTALSAGEVDGFCVDKSILAIYKTDGRSYIDAALGLMATSGNKLLKFISRVYVEFIQNTPLLLQLCFLYYALAFAGLSLGSLLALALILFNSSVIAEIVRGMQARQKKALVFAPAKAA